MASTVEMIDKQTGMLSPEQVIASQVTQVIGSLHTVMTMLPEDQKAAKASIEFSRNTLTEIRSYLEKHFAFKPAE